jgi:intracellular multiplication protein IcmV
MSAMAIKDIFKISRKTFFDPSAWLGLKELSAYNRTIGATLKTTFTPDKPQRNETFEQAMQRLKITEAELQYKAKIYRIYTLVFLAFGLSALLAGFYYLFEYGAFAAWVLSMAVAMLFAAQAFRFDFWRFQIQQRKLGCTVDEWWRGQAAAPKDPTA